MTGTGESSKLYLSKSPSAYLSPGEGIFRATALLYDGQITREQDFLDSRSPATPC